MERIGLDPLNLILIFSGLYQQMQIKVPLDATGSLWQRSEKQSRLAETLNDCCWFCSKNLLVQGIISNSAALERPRMSHCVNPATGSVVVETSMWYQTYFMEVNGSKIPSVVGFEERGYKNAQVILGVIALLRFCPEAY